MKALIRVLVSFFVFIVDVVYGDRSYSRFYVLETIARVPYFSYLSVLHLYETLGFWRRADLLKVHFAETWNELHHLLIMESLGGSDHWGDRLTAHLIAVAYYWIVVPLYMLFPRHAYYLMELIENRAYHTYDDYLNAHEVALKAQPAPQVAIDYYRDGDLYMFEEVQTATGGIFRHPQVDNLYDVFINIREDECAHVKTMAALQAPEARQSFRSPHTLSVATKVLPTVETETNLFALSATASPHPEASP
ncbi:alternative oxidase [Stenomitos frigidus]|uniref:Plastoquinol terminal oxidase n=1 Tax=Stenomitos frigidus ULC18 TaxID=2107698 RepID=A0A2T1E4D4_9CYAN|nr:alternative oxidase [Stenomitos frigidus]PSB27632.1 plastoquinol terminal oxidase [Stenomitos frigidus ULC18]